VTLEDQLAHLASIGLALDPGITIDDVLYSFDRQEYEKRPFDLLLFTLGIDVEREPWGRPFCSRVWDFDTECIEGGGDYAAIAKRLCVVAGKPDALSDVTDHIDIKRAEAWLKYKAGGRSRDWKIEVRGDWADMMVVCYVMDDLEADGCRFYGKDNGQAVVLFYLDNEAAAALNRWSGGALRPMLP
jgi:hypothetical protein